MFSPVYLELEMETLHWLECQVLLKDSRDICPNQQRHFRLYIVWIYCSKF